MRGGPRIHVRGDAAELRFGGYCAVRLGAWDLVLVRGSDPPRFAFAAPIVEQHDYWVLQRPLDLVAALGRTAWTWRAVDARLDGDSVTVIVTERPTAALADGALVWAEEG